MGEASRKNEKDMTLRFVVLMQLGSTMHVACMSKSTPCSFMLCPFHRSVMELPITKNKASHHFLSQF
jgi:hypothetical protein